MNILVTGGNGYIGSHTCVALKQAGHTPIIIDNFSNSDKKYTKEIESALGCKIKIYDNDFADLNKLDEIINTEDINGVIHFAAFKYVGESTENPIKYYENNVNGFTKLVNLLAEKQIPLVFSSSAAVYGEPSTDRVTENEPANPQSPYGWSKYMDEIILRDVCNSKQPTKGIALRYFNVIGAHESGKIGETSTSNSQNLWPFVVKAATGEIPHLSIFGGDYPTQDGTALRDYVHVMDLADAHVSALNHLIKQSTGYFDVFNVGTGRPTSVLEFVKFFEKATGQELPYKIVARRPGDPSAYFAVTDKINSTLGWRAKYDITTSIKDAWNRQQKIS